MDDTQKTFSCVLCGAKLESKLALQDHFRKHANKEIDSKGNSTNKSATINKESEVQENESVREGKITCDICPMEFDSVTLAIQHKFRKHPESSTKHYCPFCGIQFPLKFTRDKHVETHTNMSTYGSFPCSECGVVFHNSQAQSNHLKSTHKRIMSIFKPVPTPPPSKKIKINNANEALSVYYCYLCGMEYIIKFNLQKHLERSHKEEERNKVPDDLIKCTTCDALFYNKKAYDNHNMYHKPDDLYVTSEEQRLQTVTRVDQDFDIRRVQLVTDKFIPVDKPKQRRQVQPKKSKKAEKLLLDDEELSPTSSIDSSDSENESQSTTKSNSNETANKKSKQTTQKKVISNAGNSKQNLHIEESSLKVNNIETLAEENNVKFEIVKCESSNISKMKSSQSVKKTFKNPSQNELKKNLRIISVKPSTKS